MRPSRRRGRGGVAVTLTGLWVAGRSWDEAGW